MHIAAQNADQRFAQTLFQSYEDVQKALYQQNIDEEYPVQTAITAGNSKTLAALLTNFHVLQECPSEEFIVDARFCNSINADMALTIINSAAISDAFVKKCPDQYEVFSSQILGAAKKISALGAILNFEVANAKLDSSKPSVGSELAFSSESSLVGPSDHLSALITSETCHPREMLAVCGSE